MPVIVRLEDLVPEDIQFVYPGFPEDAFTLPGDLDTETVLKVFKYLRNLLALREAREDGSVPTEQEIVAAAKALHDLLLGVFQIRNPELTSLPFGAKSLPIITEKILTLLGVGGASEEPEAVPTVPASPSRKRSSTGSVKRAPRAKS